MIPNTKYCKSKGFTLIELLIVISIIALLVAAASVSWRNAQEKGRDGKRKTDLKSVQQALETYLQTNGKYPESDNGKIKCAGVASGIDWGNPFVCSSITYIQQLPKDPAYQSDATKGYYYQAGLSNLSYILSADLENINDPDRVTGGNPCTPEGTSRDYCVINP